MSGIRYPSYESLSQEFDQIDIGSQGGHSGGQKGPKKNRNKNAKKNPANPEPRFSSNSSTTSEPGGHRDRDLSDHMNPRDGNVERQPRFRYNSQPQGHGFRREGIPSGASGGVPPPAQLSNEGISAELVQKVIECPVCLEVPRPPIFNCQSGHIICAGCRSKLSECPVCRRGFSDVRNFVAEQLAESCTFKCPFNDQGCVARIKLAEEDQHVSVCNFRPLGCEVYPCKNAVIACSEYVDHLKSKHHSAFAPPNHWKSIREVPVRKPNAIMQAGCRPPFILNCHGQTFLQFTQVIGGKMWFWVSVYGTPEEAARFKVTLTLSHPQRELKSTWTGPVHSVRHSGDDVYFNGLCMVTTEECLRAFMHRHSTGNHEAFSVEVHIEKIR